MSQETDLTQEILNLRNTFHAALARKRSLKAHASEINRITKEMGDLAVQVYLERSYELRRWMQFFKKDT